MGVYSENRFSGFEFLEKCSIWQLAANFTKFANVELVGYIRGNTAVFIFKIQLYFGSGFVLEFTLHLRAVIKDKEVIFALLDDISDVPCLRSLQLDDFAVPVNGHRNKRILLIHCRFYVFLQSKSSNKGFV